MALVLCMSATAAHAAAPPPQAPLAKTAIVVDGRTGEVMWARDAGRAPRRWRALTKLMTALLTLEQTRPSQVFTSPGYDPLPAESRINLGAGERMTVADLLRALLLESANDAAVTLADGIAGSTPAFVAQMNERARKLGLDDTSYANPIGLDDPANYSSARDLAQLAVELLRKPRFARVVNRPQATLRSGDRVRVIDNRNDLVAANPWVDGVKTGHTNSAGYLLVGAAHGAGGARVVSVVMGEPSEAARDAETLELLRWGLERFERKRVLSRGQAAGERGDRVPRRARAAGPAPHDHDHRARGRAGHAPGARPRRGRRSAGPGRAGRAASRCSSTGARCGAWRSSPSRLYPRRGRCA